MNQIDPNLPIIEEIELTPVSPKGHLVVDDRTIRTRDVVSFVLRHRMFLVLVFLPLAIATIYFFAVTSDRYISEARFVIRSSSGNGAGSVMAMIENQGLSRANDETYAVNDYLASRDIVALLSHNNQLRQMLARPEADFVNRFPNFYMRDNNENLYLRYKDMVDARVDAATGISTIQVVAFKPVDAHALVAAMLKYAEDLINRLNARAYDDAERYAQAIVDRERNHVADVETRLTTYRNASGSIDPGKEAVAGLELIGKMTTEVAMLEAELQQQSAVAPGNPGLPAMKEKVRSYQAEIDRQKLQIVGGNKSLATKLSDFEKLELERELAARALGLATVNLAKAREDSGQQHLYLQTIVMPNTPDEADYSHRLMGMLMVAAASLATYSIARTLRSITLEHRA